MSDRDRVGSIFPSSRWLAKCLTEVTLLPNEKAQDFRIIEIGPGTGTITQALLEQFNDIEVIERDIRFASFIESKFRNIMVHVGDAEDHLPNIVQKSSKPSIIVSCVPLRGNPDSYKILEVYQSLLQENKVRRIVQFTYGLRSPFPLINEKLIARRCRLVLFNCPPAFIWTLEVNPI